VKSVLIEKERYVDSVFLLAISRDVKRLSGVADAVVCLATPANVEALGRVGFRSPELDMAGPNDLVIALDAATDAALAAARAKVTDLLTRKGEMGGAEGRPRPGTLAKAIRLLPEANLVLISVPGPYAGREARIALGKGLHVFLFSDNVPLEEEIALKKEAVGRGLLLMGPECGTAIVGGKPLGFANVVRRGRIGVVGASGTGIQEVTSLVDRSGGGISHAIGTGGRDLSEAVGGVMAELCLRALGEDEGTEAIVLVSKRPAPQVAKRVLAALERTGKPGVVHFLGEEARPKRGKVAFASSLAEAARLACEAVGLSASKDAPSDEDLARIAEEETRGMARDERHLRAYFCGGTLAQEAWHVLTRAGVEVGANVAADARLKVKDEEEAEGHVLLDLGDERFTRGRPHPMIDPASRDERVAHAGEDPKVALVLVDLVLGHGAHPDPATGLAEAIRVAKERAAARGGFLSAIASVTGTDADPQGYTRERQALECVGARVMDSNYDAARLAAAVLARLERRDG
jgi:succinyl-CoA synthetase alpha subunit